LAKVPIPSIIDLTPCPIRSLEMSDSTSVTVNVDVPSDRHAEFLQIVASFKAGKTLTPAPVFDFKEKDYPATLRALVRDTSTSFPLRKRLLDDENRDALDALTDAETLHAVQAKRFPAAPRCAAGASIGL